MSKPITKSTPGVGRRQQRVVRRQNILTGKSLREYVPGAACLCGAWAENECGCPDADWTPTEVYQLRYKVQKLQAKIRRLNAKTTNSEVCDVPDRRRGN